MPVVAPLRRKIQDIAHLHCSCVAQLKQFFYVKIALHTTTWSTIEFVFMKECRDNVCIVILAK